MKYYIHILNMKYGINFKMKQNIKNIKIFVPFIQTIIMKNIELNDGNINQIIYYFL